MIALLRNPLVWVGIAVVATIAVVAVIYNRGRSAGATQVIERVQQRTIETQRSIQRAEDLGPRTPRDVVKRLRDGTF